MGKILEVWRLVMGFCLETWRRFEMVDVGIMGGKEGCIEVIKLI